MAQPNKTDYSSEPVTRFTPGKQSLDLSAVLASRDYDTTGSDGDTVLKAIHVGAGGTIIGFKENDDEGGTARTWTFQAGQYAIGPWKKILNTSTATLLIGEHG